MIADFFNGNSSFSTEFVEMRIFPNNTLNTGQYLKHRTIEKSFVHSPPQAAQHSKQEF